MLRQCVGIKGKGCSRFIADWDNHSLCFACRVCSQNNPCEVCSVWTTFLWSKASAAKAKADSRRSNLCKVGETVQQVGSSRDSSLPFSEGNEGPVANIEFWCGSSFLPGVGLNWFNPWGAFFRDFHCRERYWCLIPAVVSEGP